MTATIQTRTTAAPHAQDHEDRCPRAAARRRRRRAAVLGLGLGGVCLVSSGAFAAWQATSSVSSAAVQAASTAVDIVDANGGTFATAVPNLLPGDYFYRYVDLANRGTVPSVFTGTVSASGTLGAALTVGVQSCSQPWDTTAATCPGTVTTLLPTASSSSSVPVTYGSIGTGTANAQHVRYRFDLPTTAPSTLMGQTSTISSTVSGALVGGSDRTQG